jgi:hypothetical protein
MENIVITPEHRQFVSQYAAKFDIGGFSNLPASDLNKASRLDFQYTGIYGELAFYLYRYGSYDKLHKLLQHKFETLRPIKKGDGGFDDCVSHNGLTRFIDIKTTHISDETQIPRLNLVIPEREYHPKMIYICAFALGIDKQDRQNVNKVILAGWCATENISQRWRIDPNKYAVSVNDLRPLTSLKKVL